MKFDAIFERHFGSSSVVQTIITLKGDASSRKYHRAILQPGHDIKSLIIMELPSDALASDEVTDGKQPTELPFLNVGHHFASQGLRVPKIHLDAVNEGVILLEDLGDVLLSDKVGNANIDTMKKWYCAAVDLMVTMHNKMWPINNDCQAAAKSFDYKLLRWELDHYRQWGAEALLGTLDDTVRKELDEAFDDLANEIAALPKGFVHRDYQSRNIMVINDKPHPSSLGIIDFQDALEGPRIYDLVALLNDSYVDIPTDLKEEIIKRYAQKAHLDANELKREFYLITIQRKLKDGGRFVFIDRVKNNPSFLPYIDGSFERVKHALTMVPGHEKLKTALAKTDPKRFG